jgi:hypothetical protein
VVGLLSACGGTSPKATPTRSQGHSASATPTPTSAPTSYCDAQDTPIPGAAAAFANGEPTLPNLTAVQQAWFDMDATMVPACSEITPDPPSVQTKNLTNGQLSDSDFSTWMTADNETFTLIEWAQQHDQPYVIRAFHWGPEISSLVASGGKVVDDHTCEYSEKVYAVSVTGEQMSSLTSGNSSNPGVVYAQATVGPCTTEWIASDGSVTHHDLASGQEGRELDVTELKNSPAVGQYVAFVASLVVGSEPTADAILGEVGI